MLVVCQKTKNKQQTTKRRAAIPPIPEGMGFPPLSVISSNIRNAVILGSRKMRSPTVLA
ncbi:MAG: hypothetical protein F6K47_15690 [Symploca sp. SIO2E6]|nr:hypothetical protein [Symploca sp. SIO2E6]